VKSNLTGWNSSNALDSCLGDAWFESPPGHQLHHDNTLISHNCFLPNSFQLIIQLQSYHLTLSDLATDSTLILKKINKK
jgi:hypothetical protein